MKTTLPAALADRVTVKRREAAAALGVHPVTVGGMIKAGRLETAQVGARHHITIESLRRVVAGMA